MGSDSLLLLLLARLLLPCKASVSLMSLQSLADSSDSSEESCHCGCCAGGGGRVAARAAARACGGTYFSFDGACRGEDAPGAAAAAAAATLALAPASARLLLLVAAGALLPLALATKGLALCRCCCWVPYVNSLRALSVRAPAWLCHPCLLLTTAALSAVRSAAKYRDCCMPSRGCCLLPAAPAASTAGSWPPLLLNLCAPLPLLLPPVLPVRLLLLLMPQAALRASTKAAVMLEVSSGCRPAAAAGTFTAGDAWPGPGAVDLLGCAAGVAAEVLQEDPSCKMSVSTATARHARAQSWLSCCDLSPVFESEAAGHVLLHVVLLELCAGGGCASASSSASDAALS